MEDRKALREWQWRPMVFFFLGMLSIVMLAAAYQTGEGPRRDSAVTAAIERIMIKATTAHLWFKQTMAGDEGGDFKDIRTDLDDSIRLATVILDGGESERGVILAPLKDVHLRSGIEKVRSLLTDFKTLVLQRYQEPKGSPRISIQEQSIDATFREFQDKAISLGLLFEKDRSHGRSRNLSPGILIIGAFVVVAATTALWNRDRRRRHFEMAVRQNEECFRITLEAVKNKAVPGEGERCRLNLEAIFTVDNLSQNLGETLSPHSEVISEKSPSSFLTDRELNEQRAILNALEESGWNKAGAARLLGISKRTIYRKIREYNIMTGGREHLSLQ